uniref:Uncharacterized protein n=1 Tax=Isometrus maculatus TaxID=497827 RepID=A0A0U1TYB8_ISOMC|nr:hypothetical protein [Isometrus maculatus]
MKLMWVIFFCFFVVTTAQIKINATCNNTRHCEDPCLKQKCKLPHKCINRRCTCYPRIDACS